MGTRPRKYAGIYPPADCRRCSHAEAAHLNTCGRRERRGHSAQPALTFRTLVLKAVSVPPAREAPARAICYSRQIDPEQPPQSPPRAQPNSC
jgi:hypothetical protein